MFNKCEKQFAIIGVAGYIAPRHLAAIKAIGGNLSYSHDISDSVGIIDRFFPDSYFTTNYGIFKKELKSRKIDYLSVCTPNSFHAQHSIMGLESGADVICEKPLALTMAELELMDKAQVQTGHLIHPILQLRLHPEIVRLKKMVECGFKQELYDVDLTYITPRGAWYMSSWKGAHSKSGGLATNIGVHFIDMLQWVFGSVREIVVHHSSADCISGFMMLDKARVRFFLSINKSHIPSNDFQSGCACRKMTVDHYDFDFSSGFNDLHTVSYSEVIEGKGFSINDGKAAVHTLETIRTLRPIGAVGDYHPLLLNI